MSELETYTVSVGGYTYTASMYRLPVPSGVYVFGQPFEIDSANKDPMLAASLAKLNAAHERATKP